MEKPVEDMTQEEKIELIKILRERISKRESQDKIFNKISIADISLESNEISFEQLWGVLNTMIKQRNDREQSKNTHCG